MTHMNYCHAYRPGCVVPQEAIADCRGVPQMLGLLKEAVARCPPPGRGHGQQAQQGQGGPVDLKAPGDCKAAVYAAGALLNMGGVPAVQNRMREVGAGTGPGGGCKRDAGSRQVEPWVRGAALPQPPGVLL